MHAQFTGRARVPSGHGKDDALLGCASGQVHALILGIGRLMINIRLFVKEITPIVLDNDRNSIEYRREVGLGRQGGACCIDKRCFTFEKNIAGASSLGGYAVER